MTVPVMPEGDMVQAVRSSRVVRLSFLTLGVATLAGAGLRAGGGPGPPPGAARAAARAAPGPATARRAGPAGQEAGALPLAGALPVRDVASTPRLAGPLHGVARYLRTRHGAVQVALFNKLTGRTYLLSDGRDTQYTAS